jgi:hypothetical protein
MINRLTHDEETGKRFLTKEELEDGAYYVGHCRNASVARWNAEKQQFYHWREKWGIFSTETIKHPVDDEKFDVFLPHRKLEEPKFEIPFDETEFKGDKKLLYEHNLEVWCYCGLTGKCIHCKCDARERELQNDVDA